MSAIVDGKPRGMVLAFQRPGSARQDPAPKDCVAHLGIAVLQLASAARVIADSDLQEEERLKFVQEIGLMASRLACLQVDVVRKRMDEIIIAQDPIPMPARKS